MALQRLRYGDRLNLRVEGADDASRLCELPVLLLQPLVENAPRHDLTATTAPARSPALRTRRRPADHRGQQPCRARRRAQPGTGLRAAQHRRAAAPALRRRRPLQVESGGASFSCAWNCLPTRPASREHHGLIVDDEAPAHRPAARLCAATRLAGGRRVRRRGPAQSARARLAAHRRRLPRHPDAARLGLTLARHLTGPRSRHWSSLSRPLRHARHRSLRGCMPSTIKLKPLTTRALLRPCLRRKIDAAPARDLCRVAASLRRRQPAY